MEKLTTKLSKKDKSKWDYKINLTVEGSTLAYNQNDLKNTLNTELLKNSVKKIDILETKLSNVNESYNSTLLPEGRLSIALYEREGPDNMTLWKLSCCNEIRAVQEPIDITKPILVLWQTDTPYACPIDLAKILFLL